jgi:hypothetical protein
MITEFLGQGVGEIHPDTYLDTAEYYNTTINTPPLSTAWTMPLVEFQYAVNLSILSPFSN